jgi:hypothetical protein
MEVTMEQYPWQRDAHDNILFDYSEVGLAMRRTYLAEVDAQLTLSLADFEAYLMTAPKSVLCFAPGHGKTSLCRQFICAHHAKGILYAVATIAEAQLLTYDIAAWLGPPKVLGIYHTADDFRDYLLDPTLLEHYPVIVITHQRLILDPPQMLFSLSKDFTPLDLRDGGRRKFILIDERPTFFDRLQFSDTELGTIHGSTAGHYHRPSAIQAFQECLQSPNPRLRQMGVSAYKALAQMRDVTALGITRASYRLDVLNQARDEATGMVGKDGRYRCYYHLGLIQADHMVILDGTGDLSLCGSAYWTIIKPPELSYHFVGHVQILEELKISRNIKHLESVDQLLAWVTKIKEVVGALVTQHRKLLIVTWKDLKGEISLLAHGDVVPIDHAQQIVPTELSTFPAFLQSQLATVIDLAQVEIIHYQSGKTRATSDFIDCDAVLFVGYFQIPPSAIEEYNRVNRSAITQETYLMAEVVQAIYRSRIRARHPVSVYFSSDHPAAFVENVLAYMDAHNPQGQPLSLYPWGREVEQKLATLSKVQRRIVETLLAQYPSFPATWTMTLSQKEAMALLDYKDSRNMRQVLDNLAATGIQITIT